MWLTEEEPKPITTIDDMLEEVQKVYPNMDDVEIINDSFFQIYVGEGSEVLITIHDDKWVLYIGNNITAKSVDPQKILNILKAMKDAE